MKRFLIGFSFMVLMVGGLAVAAYFQKRMQPKTLHFDTAYPGNPYTFTEKVTTGVEPPVATAIAYTAEGGRPLGILQQPETNVRNDMSNPTAWFIDLTWLQTRRLPKAIYVELTLDGKIYAAGTLPVNYSTAP